MRLSNFHIFLMILSTFPSRSQHQDVLFGEGNKCKNSKTWVVGDTLVTITTSKGCVENEGCQRCSMVKDVLGQLIFSKSN